MAGTPATGVVTGKSAGFSSPRSKEHILGREDITSESDVEDLGDADKLGTKVRPQQEQGQHDTDGWQVVRSRRRPAIKAARPEGVYWPWAKKSAWKGPLPKPRKSPARTLGDSFLLAMLRRRDGDSPPMARCLDPQKRDIQNSKKAGLSPKAGPKLTSWATKNPGLARISADLSRNRGHIPTLPRSYLAATMAGSGTRRGSGNGAGDKARNYGHNLARGGKPRGGHGRGSQERERSRSPSPQRGGRGDQGRGRRVDRVPRGGRGRGDRGRGNTPGRPSRGRELEAEAPKVDDARVNPGGAGAKHKAPTPVDEPKQKKKRKFLRCELCSDEHHTSQCALLHGPKPGASFCGLAGGGLGVFHIPYNGAVNPPKRVSATALIRIVEGNVPATLVSSELARLIPVKWDRTVKEHGKNTFIVPFPCQVELQRMVAIGSVTRKGKEGVMEFEEWNHEIKPKHKLEKVWVHVYGVPYEIRSFLPLWAVGTVLGATLRVDMKYMRKSGVVRLLVAVLDVKAIPNDANIVVDDNLYEIFFKVDKVVREEHEEAFDDTDDLDDYDDEQMGEDHEMEDAEQQGHDNGPKPDGSSGSGSSQPIQVGTPAPTSQAKLGQVSELQITKEVDLREVLPAEHHATVPGSLLATVPSTLPSVLHATVPSTLPATVPSTLHATVPSTLHVRVPPNNRHEEALHVPGGLSSPLRAQACAASGGVEASLL